MGFPGTDLIGNIYIPDPLGKRELNLSDAWRAVWVEKPELPTTAPVIYGYAVVIAEDKGYVSRRAGTAPWGAAEGAFSPTEKPAQYVKKLVAEQTGATGGQAHLVGFFECKATTHNADFPAGTYTLRPLYLYVAKKLKDLGRDSEFERRRLPMNEFTVALRSRYPEIDHAMLTAIDRYLVMRAKGEA